MLSSKSPPYLKRSVKLSPSFEKLCIFYFFILQNFLGCFYIFQQIINRLCFQYWQHEEETNKFEWTLENIII